MREGGNGKRMGRAERGVEIRREVWAELRWREERQGEVKWGGRHDVIARGSQAEFLITAAPETWGFSQHFHCSCQIIGPWSQSKFCQISKWEDNETFAAALCYKRLFTPGFQSVTVKCTQNPLLSTHIDRHANNLQYKIPGLFTETNVIELIN